MERVCTARREFHLKFQEVNMRTMATGGERAFETISNCQGMIGDHWLTVLT